MMNRSLFVLVVAAMLSLTGQRGFAQHRIRDLCEVKGQEVNTLRGVGLVVGLQGTGDPNLNATLQSLARMLTNSGIELPIDALGREDIDELQGVTNSAIVFITARVPGVGARQGSLVDCQVQAWGSAKSLVGGTLVEAALTGGPATGASGSLPTLAIATGRVDVAESDVSTSGTITDGCQLLYDFENQFFYFEEETTSESGAPIPNGSGQTDMYIDLVIKEPHAGFDTAAGIAYGINSRLALFGQGNIRDGEPELLAIAKDQRTVKVKVPEFQQLDPVAFVSDVLDVTLFDIASQATVAINERTGAIVISENVLFKPVAVSSGNFTVEQGAFAPLSLQDDGPIDGGGGGQRRQLNDLVTALNALQAPPETIIDIIKQLEVGGFLYGRLIITN